MPLVQQLKEPQTWGLKVVYCTAWGLFTATIFGLVTYSLIGDQMAEPIRTRILATMTGLGSFIGFFLIGGFMIRLQRLAREDKVKRAKAAAETAKFDQENTQCPTCGQGYVPRPPEDA